MQEGIPATLIADSAATYLMKQGKVAWVIVGADRIAANGDTANKIGTYMTAVAARHHGVKFMVVAPTSTVDMKTPDGAAIPIETRAEAEVLSFGGTRTAPEGIQAWNPAFDITPAELIDAIVTEKGVVTKPTRDKMVAMMKSKLSRRATGECPGARSMFTVRIGLDTRLTNHLVLSLFLPPLAPSPPPVFKCS